MHCTYLRTTLLICICSFRTRALLDIIRETENCEELHRFSKKESTTVYILYILYVTHIYHRCHILFCSAEYLPTT